MEMDLEPYLVSQCPGELASGSFQTSSQSLSLTPSRGLGQVC